MYVGCLFRIICFMTACFVLICLHIILLGRCGIGYRECPDGTCVRDARGIPCSK